MTRKTPRVYLMIRSLTCTALLVLLACTAGCCRKASPQPEMPASVPGWKDFEEGGVHYVGMFLLHKGESTENNEIGITLIDVTPPNLCAEPSTLLGEPRATIRFYDPRDQQPLCESTFIAGSNTLLNGKSSNCGSSMKLTSIALLSVNTKEEWVYFALSNQNLLKEP